MAALRRRFAAVQQVSEEGMSSTLRELGATAMAIQDPSGFRFVLFLMPVSKARGKDINEFACLASITGVSVTKQWVESINGRFHISQATLDDSGDVVLIGGGAFRVDFSEHALNTVMDIWLSDAATLLTLLHDRGARSMAMLESAGKLDMRNTVDGHKIPKFGERRAARFQSVVRIR